MRRSLAALALLVAMIAALVPTGASPVAAVDLSVRGLPESAEFAPLVPARVLDTRTDGTTIDGRSLGRGAVGAGQTIEIDIVGRGGVPARGVGAVALNVTVTEPTAASFVTVGSVGNPRPEASNLNVVAGQTVANLVIVPLVYDGGVSFYNHQGAVHLLADVVGWFTDQNRYIGFSAARVLDTRAGGPTLDGLASGGGAVGPTGVRTVEIEGRAGIPAWFATARAVVLNITAVDPTADTYATVWPTGQTRPTASNLNVAAGQTTPNLVVVPMGQNGSINVYNHSGSSHFLIDVMGGYGPNAGYLPVAPARLLDTRAGGVTIDGQDAGTGSLGAQGERVLHVTGRAGIAGTEVGAVVLNVTATNPTEPGYVTVWPSDAPRPNASNLNVRPGLTVANLVMAAVGRDGTIRLFNFAGTTDLVIDVVGWVPRTRSTGIEPLALAPGVVGVERNQYIAATGGFGIRYVSFTYSGGAPGLVMGSSNWIYGTPGSPGTYAARLSFEGIGGRASVNMSHLIFDPGAGYAEVQPIRVLDTRTESQPLTAARRVVIASSSGPPYPDDTAVVLRVATAGERPNTVGLTPDLSPALPTPAYLTAAGTDPRGSIIVMPLGPSGALDVSLPLGGRADVTIDVVGWFASERITTPAAFLPALDTRAGSPLAPGAEATISIPGVPLGATAAIVRVLTTDSAGGSGAVTLWPTGDPQPAVATMRFTDASPEDQRAVVMLGAANAVTVRNTGASATHVVVEVEAFLVPPPAG